MVQVLVVEDDDDLRLAISTFLRGEGISVDVAPDLPDADRLLAATIYECVVFERFLPSGDALTYVRSRRRAGWSAPVLFLTSLGRAENRLADLSQQGDYLVKPFGMTKLVAWVRSVVRRAMTDAPPVLRVGELEIDRERHEVRRSGVLLTLTSREFAVLELLAEAQGRVVTTAELYTHAWGEQAVTASNALGAVIMSLRRKLGPLAMMRPVQGVGYRLVVETLEFPVTIYLGDESAHRQVQSAVEDLVQAAGLQIVDQDDPVLGSWFRRMRARAHHAATSGLAREAATAAAHAVDSRFVLAQDATVTATMMQNLGPVLGALQPTKDAVIRAGALLIVKVEWTVAVHQLTATQQLLLDHHPQLLTSPHEILTALNLTATKTASGSASTAPSGPSATPPGTAQNTQPPMLTHNAERPDKADHPNGPGT
ncbi:response regulator transcription factor [Amycolatopsis sp. MtRt-6]|uniref:response regulator transcription factor n=1 Tax=Amycolatopsis sp. MtRt-6 TaxID=2792782 RepID=UPI0027DAC835|nr:response regulator transcription factor [Amycolatopsis sp. MtRt-6]